MIDFDRSASLNHAYQFGQAAARGDIDAESEFKSKFENDSEAKAQYDEGFAKEKEKIAKLQ